MGKPALSLSLSLSDRLIVVCWYVYLLSASLIIVYSHVPKPLYDSPPLSFSLCSQYMNNVYLAHGFRDLNLTDLDHLPQR